MYYFLVCGIAGDHIIIYQFVTCNRYVIKNDFQHKSVKSSVNVFFSCTNHNNNLHLRSNVTGIIYYTFKNTIPKPYLLHKLIIKGVSNVQVLPSLM